MSGDNHSYTVVFEDGDRRRVSSDQISSHQRLFVGDQELRSRMSEIFWLDVYFLEAKFGVDPHEILASIKEIEQGELPTGVKTASQFTRLPLKGLWHKHYFSARFLAHNIYAGLQGGRLKRLVNDVMNPDISPIVTKDMISELARRITEDPLEYRSENKNLTGEWIVFLRRNERNYYLCCAGHEFGDAAIHQKIARHCTRDFPDIERWLEECAADPSLP